MSINCALVGHCTK